MGKVMYPSSKGRVMKRCSYPACSWQAIAPSPDAAWSQYAEHIVAEHSQPVDADVPPGMVQLRFDDDGEWITVSVEDAHQYIGDPDEE
jgi:hypothetical protein